MDYTQRYIDGESKLKYAHILGIFVIVIIIMLIINSITIILMQSQIEELKTEVFDLKDSLVEEERKSIGATQIYEGNNGLWHAIFEVSDVDESIPNSLGYFLFTSNYTMIYKHSIGLFGIWANDTKTVDFEIWIAKKDPFVVSGLGWQNVVEIYKLSETYTWNSNYWELTNYEVSNNTDLRFAYNV